MKGKFLLVLINTLFFLLLPAVLAATIIFTAYLFFNLPNISFGFTLFFFILYFSIALILILTTSYAKKLLILLSYLTKNNYKNVGLELHKVRQEYDQKKFILENISEGICAVNHQAEVVFYNQKFYKKFIKPWKFPADHTPTLETIFENHDDVKQAFLRVIRLQTNESIRQILHHHKGRDLFFDITISGIEKDAQDFAAAVGVFHDVTEKRLTDLMRANFVANISHEIRTPLTSILGFTEVLESKIEHQKEIPVTNIRPYLKPIIQNAKKLQRLFSDLLTLSLIESERKIYKTQVSLEEMLDQQIYFLSANYPQKKLNLHKNIKQDLIDVDRELFQQVLTNILDNSFKYSTQDELNLEISSQLTANQLEVEIKIADANPPLPSIELERIFERFYRLDSARNIHQGSGIGLSIVKQIMTKHKGRAYAENSNGKTYFCLNLPAPKN